MLIVDGEQAERMTVTMGRVQSLDRENVLSIWDSTMTSCVPSANHLPLSTLQLSAGKVSAHGCLPDRLLSAGVQEAETRLREF